MSNTQWISVNERLPETAYSTLVLMASQGQRTGFYALKWYLHAPDGVPVEPPSPVTHWMDLPEPPAPPKPVDPFDVWWEQAPNYNNEYEMAKGAWIAAKAHSAKPIPDFETWWNRFGGKVGNAGIWRITARDIWNAAQGKQDG